MQRRALLINTFKKSTITLLMMVVLGSCNYINVNSFIKGPDQTSEESIPVDLKGVNIMDLASAQTNIPGVFGVDYIRPNLTSLQYLKSRGHAVIRIPFLWERVQPILNGPLNTAYMNYILGILEDAHTAGLKVILDMHNFGRYEQSGTLLVLGSTTGPTKNQFNDVWTKIVNTISADADANAAVFAYDIMNEPYNLPDTRNTIDTSATITHLATFATDTESWDPRYGDTAHYVLTRDARNSGSLRVTFNNTTSGFQIVGTSKNFATPLSIANGSLLRIQGNIPNNITGNTFRIRLTTNTVSGSPSTYLIGEYSLNPGDFEVNFIPTATEWADMRGLFIELLVNDSVPSTMELFVDDVSQGFPMVGVSPQRLWEEFSQSAVDAIRATGSKKTIMVEGYDFSSAKSWATNHPVKWITDPQNKIIYQAHSYWDTEMAGYYNHSFAAEVTNASSEGYSSMSARAIAHLSVFTDWVQAQGVNGYIGEFGWPNSVFRTDSASWDIVGEDAMTFLDSKKMGYTFWGTGTWLQPTSYILNPYDLTNQVPLSPSAVLESHL